MPTEHDCTNVETKKPRSTASYLRMGGIVLARFGDRLRWRKNPEQTPLEALPHKETATSVSHDTEAVDLQPLSVEQASNHTHGEIEKTILEERFSSVEALRRYANGEIETLDLDEVSGHIALLAGTPNTAYLKAALLDWSRYYAEEIKDFQVYYHSARENVVISPSTLAAFITVGDRLLDVAEATVLDAAIGRSA